MDPRTHGTSRKKHNLGVFSSWKISGALEKLTSAQAQLQLKVDMIARKRSEDMHQTEVIWLVEAKNLLLHAEILKTEMNDAKQFLVWKQSCGLSDKFAKMTMDIRRKMEDIDKLEVKPIAGVVGHTVEQKDDQESSSSSSSSLSLPKKHYILSKSARRAVFEIMEAFQDVDVKFIGLVGMGRVGKTTLAILMGMKAKESCMFDAVIKISGMSSEGIKPDLRQIRSDIAKALDSKWNDGEVGEDSSRASELIGGIVKKVDKILIILDDVDVWEVTDLKAIGIPFSEDHKGCKILLTTHLPHVCQGFGCQTIVHLRETGIELRSEPKYLRFIEVELGSFPFGTAYQGSNVEKQMVLIAKSLKLNYDYLNDEKKQSFFLLCSHFPRKYAPTVEELTRYGIGQGLFNDYESIESARKEAHSIVSSLQSSLIVEEEDYCIRMCDAFHMLALWIENSTESLQTIRQVFSNKLSKDGKIKFFASSTTIFLQTSQFPSYEFFDLTFIKLQTLTIIEDDYGANFYKDRRFGCGPYMAKLNVLCLQAGSFPSGDWVLNPPTLSLEGIENLKDLQTLQVKGYKVKGLSSLVKLNKLEIFGFLGCTFEDKLPEGLGELHNLKMLDFSYCVKLHQQPHEWILQLSKLEQLYITDVSLGSWSRSNFLQRLQQHNSRLSLTVLSQVNSAICLQQLVFPRFSRYSIQLIYLEEGSSFSSEKEVKFVHFKPISSSKALRVKALPMSPFVELFKDVEYLHLSDAKDCHNIVPSLDKGGLSGLQDLRLHDCKDLEYLINDDLVQVCVFSKLTNLELVGLAKLKSLWEGGGHMIDLGNLKSFHLRDCHNLKGYVFSQSIAQNLKHLEILEVNRCPNLEVVFELCSDVGPVCLPKLVIVKIYDVKELLYVFPSYVIEGLPQLRELQVSFSSKLEHVFISTNDKVDEQNGLNRCCHLELPQLQLLVLGNLYALKNFCRGKDFIVAPLLEELQVSQCLKLEPFTLTLNNNMLPRLKKLCLGSGAGSEVPDAHVVKAYTKMSKRSRSRPHFIIGWTRPFDSLGTYFLSNLKELKLGNHNMKDMWKDSTISGLHNLTHLSLDLCLRLEYVFTPLSVHNMPHLKCLSIKSCLDLGQIIAEDETTTEAHGQQHRPIWFPNLSDIYISGCQKLRNVFPARLADQLPKLKRLHLEWGMPSLTQIFGPDRDSRETSNSKVVQLLLLQNLILKGLRNMVRFAPEGLHFTFPALNHLEVRDCTKMQTCFYAVEHQGVCAITESQETWSTGYVRSTLLTNAPVALSVFSGDNYELWRHMMRTYFESQDLWEVVQNGIIVPSGETSNDKQLSSNQPGDQHSIEKQENGARKLLYSNNQKKKDAQALSIIQNALVPPICLKIIGARSAKDAWLTLKNLYSTADDPLIRIFFSGNEQEAKRWSNAKKVQMDSDNNILWPDGRSASEHEKPITVDMSDPDALRALDLI